MTIFTALALALVVAPAAAAAKPKPKPVVPAPGRIYVVRADGSHLRLVANGVRGIQGQPAWSPDGRTIAFAAQYSYGEPAAVYTVDASGKHVRQLIASDSGLTGGWPTWSPDGRLAAVVTGWKYLPGPPTIKVLLGAAGDVTSPADWPAWSPDGSTFAFVDANTLMLVGADGSGRRAIASSAPSTLSVTAPAWSPDGNRLAYALVDANGNGHVLLVDVDGAHVLDITREGSDLVPTWSPDGTRLAVLRTPRGAKSRIVTIAADGTGARLVKQLPRVAVDGRISWSARGGLVFAYEKP